MTQGVASIAWNSVDGRSISGARPAGCATSPLKALCNRMLLFQFRSCFPFFAKYIIRRTVVHAISRYVVDARDFSVQQSVVIPDHLTCRDKPRRLLVGISVAVPGTCSGHPRHDPHVAFAPVDSRLRGVNGSAQRHIPFALGDDEP